MKNKAVNTFLHNPRSNPVIDGNWKTSYGFLCLDLHYKGVLVATYYSEGGVYLANISLTECDYEYNRYNAIGRVSGMIRRRYSAATFGNLLK